MNTGGLALATSIVTGVPVANVSGGRAVARSYASGGSSPIINPEYALVAGQCPRILPALIEGASVNISMDMTAVLPPGTTIDRIAVASGVIIGVDDDPEDIFTGAAIRFGNVIIQRVQGGIAGNTYAISFIVTMSDGQIVIAQGFLPFSMFA